MSNLTPRWPGLTPGLIPLSLYFSGLIGWGRRGGKYWRSTKHSPEAHRTGRKEGIADIAVIARDRRDRKSKILPLVNTDQTDRRGVSYRRRRQSHVHRRDRKTNGSRRGRVGRSRSIWECADGKR